MQQKQQQYLNFVDLIRFYLSQEREMREREKGEEFNYLFIIVIRLQQHKKQLNKQERDERLGWVGCDRVLTGCLHGCG
jgi:hypothetical protein